MTPVEHKILRRHEREHRERLERYAARGCRISAYMLEHGCGFPDAIEALARMLPRPAVVYRLEDYRPVDDD